jgi:hypothetical protein
MFTTSVIPQHLMRDGQRSSPGSVRSTLHKLLVMMPHSHDEADLIKRRQLLRQSSCDSDHQVLGGRVEGDTVKLEIEPAKGGDKEELEADVVLVSAGRSSSSF